MKRLSWGSLNGITCILIRGDRGRIDMRAPTHGGSESTEVEVGVMWSQTKACWQRPGTGRGQEQILPCSTEGAQPCRCQEVSPVEWFQTSGFQNWERINFCFSEPPRVWWLVTAATGAGCRVVNQPPQQEVSERPCSLESLLDQTGNRAERTQGAS